MNCSDCNHARHKAGQCKNCNCGQSEISQPGAYVREYQVEKKQLSPARNCGHRVKRKKADQ